MLKTLALLCVFLSIGALGLTREERDENFFKGLEQGFFLRNDPHGYKQYECPELNVNSDK